MTDVEHGRAEHSVVLDGKLNPAIFQPFWLVSVGILAPEEAEEAPSPLVSPEVALIRTPRLSLQVTHERLLVRGRGRAQDRDIAWRTAARLLEVLPHTPISSLDMIHEAHLSSESAPWRSLATHLTGAQAVDRLLPGSLLQEFTLDRRDDRDGARLTLVLEPSQKLPGGTYVRFHQEYEDTETESPDSAVRIAAVLNNRWAESATKAEETIVAVESLAR